MRPVQLSKSKSKSKSRHQLLKHHNQQYHLYVVLVVTTVLFLVDLLVVQEQRHVFALVPLSSSSSSSSCSNTKRNYFGIPPIVRIKARSRHQLLPVIVPIRWFTFDPYKYRSTRDGRSRLFLMNTNIISSNKNETNTESSSSTATGRISSVSSVTTTTTTTTATLAATTITAASSSSSTLCPYSMKFTPYKIDLSTTTLSSDLLSSTSNKPKNIFQSLFNDVTKSVLSISRNQQEKEIINNIDTDSTSRSNNNNNNIQIQIQWITQQQNTLQCYSTLWTILSKLLLLQQQQQQQQEQQSNDNVIESTKTTTTTSTTTTVFCFPDANKMVLLNWYEIITWMIHHIEEEYASKNNNNNTSSNNPLIQVFYKDTYNIPRIELRLRNNNINGNDKTNASANSNNNIRQQQQQQQQQQHIPNYYYDHTIVTKQTQNWVQRVLVNYSICPFTKSIKRSGQGLADVNVPVGKISYHTSQSQPPPILNSNDEEIDDNNTINAKLQEQEQEYKDNLLVAWTQLQADTWDAIVNMFITVGDTGVDGISSILLSSPGYNNNFIMWCGPIFTLLEAGVVASQSLDTVGIVCFHPLYSTPDGTTWPGFGQMHSIPRLSKWYNDTIIDQQRTEQKLIEKTLRIQNQQQQKQQVSETILTATRQEQDQDQVQNDLKQEQDQFLSLNDIAAGGAWQRRTPHATINILRANQLAAAETKRITSLLYTNNIQKLIIDIGCTRLQKELMNDITNY